MGIRIYFNSPLALPQSSLESLRLLFLHAVFQF